MGLANFYGLRNALGTHSVPHWAHGTPKKLTIVDTGSNKIKIFRLGLNFVSYSLGSGNNFQETFSRKAVVFLESERCKTFNNFK